MDVVVDHADVLHERVRTRRPHEPVPLRLQLRGERLRLRRPPGPFGNRPRCPLAGDLVGLRERQRLGDADSIARALPTVAWILPRLRMIETSWTNRSTSRSVIAATLARGGPGTPPGTRPAPEHDRPAQPTSNTPGSAPRTSRTGRRCGYPRPRRGSGPRRCRRRRPAGGHPRSPAKSGQRGPAAIASLSGKPGPTAIMPHPLLACPDRPFASAGVLGSRLCCHAVCRATGPRGVS
jgi:hypothetical protein